MTKIPYLELMGLCLLTTVSMCIGICINQFRDNPVPWVYLDKAGRVEDAAAKIAQSKGTGGERHQISPADKDTPRALSGNLNLEEFRLAREREGVLVLDARPELFHRIGHIPGAISLPRDNFEAAYPGVEAALRQAGNLILYCASLSCEDAELVRKGLVQLGYYRLSIFNGGWSEWTANGLPEESEL